MMTNVVVSLFLRLNEQYVTFTVTHNINRYCPMLCFTMLLLVGFVFSFGSASVKVRFFSLFTKSWATLRITSMVSVYS